MDWTRWGQRSIERPNRLHEVLSDLRYRIPRQECAIKQGWGFLLMSVHAPSWVEIGVASEISGLNEKFLDKLANSGVIKTYISEEGETLFSRDDLLDAINESR